MNPIPLPWMLLAFVVCLAVGGIGGHRYAEGRHASEELKRKAMLDEIREANATFADGIATQTAEAISGIRIENKTINNEVRHEREIHQVLTSADCVLPASTVGVLNRARNVQRDDDRPSPGKPAPAVPAAAPDQGKPTPR